MRFKKIAPLLSITLAVLLAGCDEERRADRDEIKICIDRGGVPIRAWWDATVLGDCIFPPQEQGG